MGCGETLMKIILVIINLILLLVGILMLAFGITAKASPHLITKIFDALLPIQQQEHLDAIGLNISGIVISNSVFMIVLGCVVIVVTTFGFIGACCMVRWMLIVYSIILILVLLAEIALIIFAAVYTEKFREEIQKGMRASLNEYRYGLRVNSTGHVSLATEIVDIAWDGLQFKQKCCGAYNYTDYKTLTNWNNTKIYPGQTTPAAVPLSCCKTKTTAGDTPSSPNDFENYQLCLNGDAAYINEKDCYEAVKDSIEHFVREYKGIAIGIAAAICGIELILIIFSIVLAVRAGKEDKYV